jgi:uncharacterized OB-fold protein
MSTPAKAQPAAVRGTAVEKGDREVFSTSYAPRLQYAWDVGEGIGRYLDELRQGRLVARRCRQCERVMIPPRMFCEVCFRPTDEWVPVQDTGRINTFSLCYVTWDVRMLEHPEIPAVIEIDGASTGMGILHLVRGVDPKKVRIGMPVRAVWKPPAARTGSITDIEYWTPVSRSGEPPTP